MDPTRPRVRRAGWTAERQLAFLDALAGTRSVTRAAAAAGLSRESAHRLRARRGNGLFVALWDRIVGGAGESPRQGHNRGLGDGSLTRLLGAQFRRERGDYARIGGKPSAAADPDRTRPL